MNTLLMICSLMMTNCFKISTNYFSHIFERYDEVCRYNQRGPLETPFFRHFLRLVLSCINADFCVQGRIFQHFSSSTFFPLHRSRFLWFFKAFAPVFAKIGEFLQIFTEDSRFCIFSSNFNGISPEFYRISKILQKMSPRLIYF